MKVCIALFAVLALPALAWAQDPAVVEFDHATGAARLITSTGDTTALGKNPVVRLPRSVPVEVRVVNTNTALYRFSTESKSTALPEAQSVQSFMASLNPYLPGLRTAARNAMRGKGVDTGVPKTADANAAYTALATSINSARSSMVQLADVLYGERGLQDNLTASLLALEKMRQGVAPEAASEPLRRELGLGEACREEAPVRLPVAQRLLSALTEVVAASQSLQTAMELSAGISDERVRMMQDSAQMLARQTYAAVGDFEPMVANAYRVERLVAIVASACSHWSGGTVQGTLTKGRDVTVRVEPRTEVETSRLAERGPVEYTVSVLPRTILRPALGFAAIAAPDARFANYGTRDVTGGVEIYETGTRDARFAVGGTLGFTWPGLDYRETRGFAVWLPEFTIAPGRVTAFGVGGALSWSFLKLGGGVAFVRYGALEGAHAGDVVSDESVMQINDTYSSPKLYFSVGVFDWAPLAGRLSGD